jgi:hypothetical protein
MFGREHVDRYRETDGEEGHDWQGTTVLLLTTTGHALGAGQAAPLDGPERAVNRPACETGPRHLGDMSSKRGSADSRYRRKRPEIRTL